MTRPWIQDHKRSEMRDKTYQRPVIEMLKLILQKFFCRKGPPDQQRKGRGRS